LRDHGLDLVVLVLNEIELLLHVGFGHHIAVPRQVGIGIQAEHPFGIFDPANCGAFLFQVNVSIRAIGDQKIATEDNFWVREIHDGIAARMRGRPVVKTDMCAIDGQLICLVVSLGRKAILGRRMLSVFWNLCNPFRVLSDTHRHIRTHTTATLTLWIGGSESNRQSHCSPPSLPIHS
jgi:hypothetical protein